MDLPHLTEVQRQQIHKQMKEHQHEKIVTSVELSPGKQLENFVIFPNVWNPVITSSRYYARYLYQQRDRLFKGKKVLDVGSGTGILGVVMGLFGAAHVTFSDISPFAIENIKENIKRFGLGDRSSVVQGDLFEHINEKFDFIVFNLPFFSETPQDNPIAASMMIPPEKVDTFFQEADSYLNENAILMIPSFDLAGDRNNPQIQGSRFGFTVKTTFTVQSTTGIQKGKISIHELTPR